MLVICPIFDRAELLPFYIKHYRSVGATKIVLALWKGESNPCFDLVSNFISDEVILRRFTGLDYYSLPRETVFLNRIRVEFKSDYPWQCIADLDEFCWFGGTSMEAMAEEAGRRGHAAVHGNFFDRFARTAEFPAIPVNGSLDETFPLVGDMTRCAGICIDKCSLFRSDIAINNGHHYVTTGSAWMDQIEVHHFKWTAGVKERLAERASFEKAQNLPWGGETLVALDRISNDGFITDPVYCWREARKLGV